MNPRIEHSIQEFLRQKSVAIVGCSWGSDDPAPHVFQKLKGLGFEVFAISESQTCFKDVPVFPSIAHVPASIGAVLVTGNARLSAQVVQQCVEKNIKSVWLHSMLGTSPKKWMAKMEYAVSSVGPEAIALAKQYGIDLIPGGCPMMFCNGADLPHRAIRGFLNWMGCFEERVYG